MGSIPVGKSRSWALDWRSHGGVTITLKPKTTPAAGKFSSRTGIFPLCNCTQMNEFSV
jgi:hypothetical protein